MRTCKFMSADRERGLSHAQRVRQDQVIVAASAEALESRVLLASIQVAADVRPNGLVNIESIVKLNQRAYFKEWFDHILWSSAGTDATKVRVCDASNFTDLTATGNRLFARDVYSGAFWTSTGAANNVTQLIVPGLSSDQGNHFVYGNQMLFAGKNADDTITPWISDGTVAGTYSLTTATLETRVKPTISGGMLYFVAKNGSSDWLYKSDGTAAGTTAIWKLSQIYANELAPLNGNVLVSLPNDLEIVTPTGSASRLGTMFNCTNLTNFSDRVYFNNGNDLWTTDGTFSGTNLYTTLAFGSPGHYTQVGPKLMFLAAADSTFDLHWWVTDDTAAGTSQVSTVPISVLIDNTDITVADDHIFFPAETAAEGTELWMTDGTSAGTNIVQDFTPGTGSSNPGPILAVNDTVYFQASPASFSTKLYSYTLDPTCSISGVVYRDGDASGSRSVDDPGLQQITVYDDINNNGTPDTGEARTLTDASGAYTLPNLPSGLHHVRIVRPNGSTQVTPAANAANDVTLTRTSPAGSTDFGLLSPVYTTTTLGSSLSNSTYGQDVTFTATVASCYGTPTGSVSFKVDGVAIGSPITVAADGTASLTLSTLTATSHTITASYAGSADAFFGASGGSFLQAVTRAPLSASVTSTTRSYGSANPVFVTTIDGLVGSDNISIIGSTTASQFTHPGRYSVIPAFSDPDSRLANYTVTSTPGTLTITKANQTITWSTPNAVIEGTTLGAAQLNAKVTGVTGGSVPGTLTYNPPTGLVLTPGDVTLSVSAAATTDYNAASANVVLTVTADNPPSAVALTNASIAENSPIGTSIGTIYGLDPDPAQTDSLVFSLVPSASDNALFRISGNQLLTNATFDFESQRVYSVTIRATDTLGKSFDETLPISITNVNENPTDITLTNASIAEHSPAGTSIGQPQVIDPDINDDATVELVPGDGSTDNALFQIVNGQLQAKQSFNFEAKNSYSIRVRGTDAGGLFVEKVFTISVTNVNEAPTGSSLSASTMPENRPVGTAVGTLSATDPDTGDTFSYTLVSGTGSTDNASFQIVGNQLQLKSLLDYETKQAYSIRVRVTDKGGLWFEKVFAINVTDVNEAPTSLTPSKSTIAENAPSGTVIGTLSATDPDANNTFSYSLVSGTGSTDNASFQITNNQLKTTKAFDYETKNSYSIRVRVTDQGGLTFDKVLTIGVTDVAEPLVINGTAGNDTITLTLVNGKIHVVNNGVAKDYALATTPTVSIYGLAGNDKITVDIGTKGVYIDGGDGFDSIVTGAGNDTIYGGMNADTIYAGAGDDLVYGNDGPDQIHGGAGNDSLFGSKGADTLWGDDGNDTLTGGIGSDVIWGGNGDDRLVANDGERDTIHGEAGTDTLLRDSVLDYWDGIDILA